MPESTFSADEGWLAHLAHPSTPRFAPPPGSVDAHCHVFGPGETFPYAPTRKYTPADASKEQLFALRDHLGFSRNVIVQASCHGRDNSALKDALVAAGGRARGVAVIGEDTPDSELRELDATGVRGIRFNFLTRLADPRDDPYYQRLADRVAPLGWHVVVYVDESSLEGRWQLLTRFPTDVVVDHMGRPDVARGVDGPSFRRTLRLLDENSKFWVKVSGAERLSEVGPPDYADVVPFARRLVETYSDRVLWGTDWPHPNMRSHMPDDGRLVDLVGEIAPSEELRRKLLVANTIRLYWPELENGQDGSPQ